MKILVITPTFLPIVGGAELGIHEIYSRVSNAHEVVILTPFVTNEDLKNSSKNNDDYISGSYKVVNFEDRLATKNEDFILIRFLKKLLAVTSIEYIFALNKLLKDFKPDVINFHYAIPTGLCLIYAHKIKKLPTVLSLVGRVDVYRDDTSLVKKIYLYPVIHTADYILPITDYCLPIKLANKKVVPYGVTISDFDRNHQLTGLRDKYQIADNKFVLFSIQRLSKVKRVDILVQAVKDLLDLRKDFVLLIGGKGPEHEYLDKLIHELGVSDYVRLIGYISEEQLPDYFSLCKIFVFHSTNETFGIVLAQAMASGKPIVTTNTTCIPEVVVDGENGLLVPPNDSKSFAEAINSLLNNTNQQNFFSKNNKEKAIKYYNWDVISQDYLEVMRSVA